MKEKQNGIETMILYTVSVCYILVREKFRQVRALGLNAKKATQHLVGLQWKAAEVECLQLVHNSIYTGICVKKGTLEFMDKRKNYPLCNVTKYYDRLFQLELEEFEEANLQRSTKGSWSQDNIRRTVEIAVRFRALMVDQSASLPQLLMLATGGTIAGAQQKEQQEAKVAKMKAEEKDEYDIRKQEEVLAETVMMIPDTRGRLERGVVDLEELLEDDEAVELGEVEEAVAAREAVRQSKVVLGQEVEDAPEPEPES